MPLLKTANAHLAFGHHLLLDSANFLVDSCERVAIIGRNGSGKSSLMAALAGVITLDEGEVWRSPGLRVGYVPQEPKFEYEHTVFETVVSGMGETSKLLEEYHGISYKISTTEDSESDEFNELLNQLSHLQSKLEESNAWAYQSRAEQMISKFDLDAEAKVTTLSGGQQKRLALARSLAHSPEVLLLDEPTNHLDIAAILWLEQMLCSSDLCIVFITHDRQFLQNVATRIIELDRGKIASFPGNFQTYQERKAIMLNDEEQNQARADKLLKAEEVWIRQGVQGRRTRSVFRVAQLEKLRADRQARRERVGQVKIEVDRGDRGGKLVAELENVSKSFFATDSEYSEKVILRDFSTRIMAGDKVGLIGRNGAGKTTLLQLILGELEPDSGSVRLGTKQTIAYFDQFRVQLDPDARLIDVIGSGSEFIEINGKRKHVISYLEDFLFPAERSRSKVSVLSGGERNRLLLAKLFARPANVLVLDEPTNDLDIETLELLEQLLSEYNGTVFLVSHDRSFLDNIVTQSIVYEGDTGGKSGAWREYVGGYSDWLHQSKASSASTSTKKSNSTTKTNGQKQTTTNTSKTVKLSWKENKELEEIPTQIASLEAEQITLTARMADPNLYRTNPQEAQTIASRASKIESELLLLLERWEKLDARK